MKITLQFVFAILFAAGAAGANWYYLSMKSTPKTTEFVIVAEDIPFGETITSKQLKAFKVLQPTEGANEIKDSSLIPYNRREVLYNMKAPKNYKKGDFVLFQDLKLLGPPVFDTIGPFRLISVGDQLTNQDLDGSGSGKVLTLAVKEDYDEKTKRLLQIIKRQEESGSEDPAYRILGVELLKPPADTGQPETSNSLEILEGEVAIFVNISDLESNSGILLAGQQIRFRVPKTSNLISE